MPQQECRKYILERIKIVASGCWEWQRKTDYYGYGRAQFNGKGMNAHRASYLAFVGDIPKGLMACHHCDNASCVNPRHIYIANQKQNMIDASLRGRAGGQKLNAEDYARIQDMWRFGGRNKDIAELFDISIGYVGMIGARKVKLPHYML